MLIIKVKNNTILNKLNHITPLGMENLIMRTSTNGSSLDDIARLTIIRRYVARPAVQISNNGGAGASTIIELAICKLIINIIRCNTMSRDSRSTTLKEENGGSIRIFRIEYRR